MFDPIGISLLLSSPWIVAIIWTWSRATALMTVCRRRWQIAHAIASGPEPLAAFRRHVAVARRQ